MGDRRHALEAAIDADATDDRAYAVYGDFLQELGDPRGELIALQLAGQEAHPFLRAHPELIPPGIQREALTWRAGFIARAAVFAERGLLDHPSARFVTALSIHRDGEPAAVIEELVARPRLALRELDIGGEALRGSEARRLVVTDPRTYDLSPVWRAAPRLVRLRCHHFDVTLGTINHATLVELSIETRLRTRENLNALAAADLPAVEHLVLDLWDPRWGARDVDRALRRMLLGRGLPRLRHLTIHGGNFGFARDVFGTDDPAAPLAADGVLARLRSLDLPFCSITDEDAGLLARWPLRLARLDVSRNYLSTDGIRQLSRIAETVVADNQIDPVVEDDLYDE